MSTINLISKFNEECAEGILAACKYTLYGPDSVNPDLPKEKQITNTRHLEEEISDIFAAILDMAEAGIIDYGNVINLLESKKGRREHFKNFQLPTTATQYYGLVEHNGNEGEDFGVYFSTDTPAVVQRLFAVLERLESFGDLTCEYSIDGPYTNEQLDLIEQGAANDYMARVTIIENSDELLTKIEEFIKEDCYLLQVYKSSLVRYASEHDYCGDHLDLKA